LHTAQLSQDNTKLLTACHDCTAKLFDVETGAKLQTFGIPSFQRLPISQQGAPDVGHTGAVVTIAFSPNGECVLTGGDHSVRLWNIRSGKCTMCIDLPYGVNSTAFSRDGNWILLASRLSTQVRICNAATGECKHVLSCMDVHSSVEQSMGCQCTLSAATLSQDGMLALTVVSRCYTAELWDIARLEIIAKVEFVHDAEVTSVAISDDSLWALTSSLDRTAKLWSLRGGMLTNTMTYKGHTAAVNSAVFSPTGGSILTSSEDLTARIWDMHTGICTQILRGHRKNIRSAVFGPIPNQIYEV